MVAVLIGALISVALTRLFSSSLRQSLKGSSHLTNMQNAAVLLNQLEADLRRAVKVTASGESGRPASVLELSIPREGGERRIFYRPEAGNLGYARAISDADGDRAHVFGRGLVVSAEFRPAVLGAGRGLFVDIRVKANATGGEEHRLHTFLYAPALPENRTAVTLGWNAPATP
jgi:hypothetical protein